MNLPVISIILMCITVINALGFRDSVETLVVNNGARWGIWRDARYCDTGEYGIGYKLKIERPQGRRRDDTALNGIGILCGTTVNRSVNAHMPTSDYGGWGDWQTNFVLCAPGEFLTSFKLQVERYVGRADDTAANFVVFRCRGFIGGPENVLKQGNGYGVWGNYGGWSKTCPLNSAICGLTTKLEPPQGRGDDTALNNVKFFCCNN